MADYKNVKLVENNARWEIVLVDPGEGKDRYAFLKDTSVFAKGSANKAKVEAVRRSLKTQDAFMESMEYYASTVEAWIKAGKSIIDAPSGEIHFELEAPKPTPAKPKAKVVQIPRPRRSAVEIVNEVNAEMDDYAQEVAVDWTEQLKLSRKAKKHVKISVETAEFGNIDGYLRGIQGVTAFWTTNHKSALRNGDGKLAKSVKRCNVELISLRD